MPFEVWRAVSWPFVGSVFWWLAGRGVEGLSAALRRRIVDPKIGWIEVTVSLAVFALGGIAFLGLISEVHADQLTIALAMGSGLWMMLGAVTVAAKVLQWRLCRRKGKCVALTSSSTPEQVESVGHASSE